MRGDKRVERIVINKLGPIDYCDFNINDFMIFTGPQASGKSTIAKSIFFFKNIRNLILKQINRGWFYSITDMAGCVKQIFKRNRILEI